MSRTRDTAAAILKGRSLTLQTTPELREMSYGNWEGMTHKELRTTHADSYAEYLKGDVAFAPPGGESAVQLLDRLGPIKERLLASHGPNQDILVVSHGGTIKGLLVLLMDMPPDLFWRFTLAHGSISVVRTYDNTTTLESWNDVSHLGNDNG